MSIVDLYADLDMSARLMALEKEHEGAVLMLLKLGKLTPVRIVLVCLVIPKQRLSVSHFYC